MAPVRTTSSGQASAAAGPATASLIRVKWETRTAAFANTSVQTIIKKACAHFRLVGAEDECVLLGDLEGDELELTDDTLKIIERGAVVKLQRIPLHALNPLIKSEPSASARSDFASVSTRTSAACSVPSATNPRLTAGTQPQLPITQPSRQSILITVSPLDGDPIPCRCYPSTIIRKVIERVAGVLGKCPDDIRLIHGVGRVNPDWTISSADIKDGDDLLLALKMTGGKPVIYLFPPAPLADATVSLRLVLEWSFSHVYPIMGKNTLVGSKQEVSWSVSAQPDGSLVENDTGLELAYLFWEATSNATLPPSPPASPLNTTHIEHFNPAYPVLEPSSPTTVLLPLSDLLSYLDAVLKSLTLHTSARNDFITYWLPALSKKPYVALRFLPQPVYERAAELAVVPTPDVMTRVFMLFRGVAAEDAESETWSAARARKGEVDWMSVVGIKAAAWDETIFRVLEWGAMEVQ